MPLNLTAKVPTSTVDQAYDCAVVTASGLGYTMQDANKPSGFFKVERSAVAGPSSIHWGQTLTDEITVLIIADPTDRILSMKITGTSGVDAPRGSRLVEPSARVTADAKAILAQCAK